MDVSSLHYRRFAPIAGVVRATRVLIGAVRLVPMFMIGCRMFPHISQCVPLSIGGNPGQKSTFRLVESYSQARKLDVGESNTHAG